MESPERGLGYTGRMEAKARTQRIETEIPVQLFTEMQSLVNTGWFRSLDDVVLDALRRFLESHQEELMEGLLREDIEWGLHGRD